jgi:hypothetical protein
MICWQALVKFFCQGVKKALNSSMQTKKIMLWKNLPKKADSFGTQGKKNGKIMFTLL